MFCIVALIILSALGTFSASYRSLARDALDCVFRRVTLRPCITGFDEKMKSRILGSVINRSATAAALLNRNFELISWALFLLMLVSTVFVLHGFYLFYVTGSCSGSNQDSFCIFDPKGKTGEISAVSQSCKEKPQTAADVKPKGVDLSDFPALNPTGKRDIVLIGCYGCSHTRKIYPVLEELAEQSGARLTFLNYPLQVNSFLSARLAECVYRMDRDKYWQLNDILFTTPVKNLDDIGFARKTTLGLGLDWEEVSRCLDDPATKELVDRRMQEVAKTGFYGTPTVFVDDRVFVGPKPRRVYAIALDGLFYWLKRP